MPKNRLLRFVVYAAAGVVGVVCLITIALAIVARSDWGRAWVATTIEQAASTPDGQRLDVGQIDGNLLGVFSIDEILLGDKDGDWLAIQALAVSWRPTALLRGEADVLSLTAERVHVRRAPVAAAPAEDTDDAPLDLSLPIGISLDRMEIAAIDLEPAVLGERIELQMQGAVQVPLGGLIDLALDIKERDAASKGARLALRYDPPAETLKVDVTYDEAEGGLVSRLLEADGLSPASLRIAGEGPVADWNGTVNGIVPGAGSVDAAINLARKDGLAFKVTGTGKYLGEDPPQAIQLAGESLDFSATGVWRDDEVLVLESAHAETPAGRLDASGQFAVAPQTMEMRARAVVKDRSLYGRLVPDLDIGSLAVDVTASGKLSNPRVGVEALAEDIKTPDAVAARVETKVDAELKQRSDGSLDLGPVKVNGRMTGAAFPGMPELQDLAGDAIQWTFVGAGAGRDAFDIQEFRVSAKAAEVTVDGTVALDTGDADLTANLKVGDLAGVGALAGMPVSGSATVRAPFTVKAFGDAAQVDLSGRIIGLTLEDPALRALVGGDTAIKAKIDYAEDRLVVTDAVIDAVGARLTAAAKVTDAFAILDADYDLEIKKPDAVAAAAEAPVQASPVRIKGVVSGPAANPGTTGRLSVDRVEVEGSVINDLSVAYQVTDMVEAAAGKIDFKAKMPAGDTSASTVFKMQEKALDVTAFTVKGPGISGNGKAVVPLDGAPVRGDLKLDMTALRPWLALAGVQGNAAGTVRLGLSEKGGKQAADLVTRLRDISLTPPDQAPVSVASLALDATSSDLLEKQSGTVTLRLTDVTASEGSIARAEVKAAGAPAKVDVDASVTGKWHGDLSMKLRGRIERGADRLRSRLTRLTGTALGRPVKLNKPLVVELGDKDVKIDTLDLGFGEGRITAAANAGFERLKANASLRAFPLGVLRPFLNTDIAGSLDGDVKIDGPLARLQGTGRITGKGIRLASTPKEQSLALAVKADWKDNRAAVDGTISASKSLQAAVRANVPLRFDPAAKALDMPPAEKISGEAVWRGDIAEVWPYLPLDMHRLAGESSVDIRLAGTVGMPQVDGQVTLAKGRYENLLSGTVLDNLTLDVVLAGDSLKIQQFSATDGGKGSMEITGGATVDPKQDFPFDVRTTLTDFTVVRRDDVTAAASAEITVAGTTEKSKVAGTVTTTGVEIQLIDQLPPTVVELDVTEINGPAGTRVVSADRRAATPPPDIDLDVLVELPRRVFVRGRGLDSEWGGTIKISGTAAEPKADGKLELVRGQVSVVGKTFKLDSGTVTLPPGDEISPEIDVVAIHTGDDLETTVRIAGPVANPEITFSSVPDLPQDEIIAKMLFNKSAAGLSPIEAVQLAAALAELSGGGGGGVMDFARKTLGVDVLRVESDGTGSDASPALNVGKYVSDGVYVGVKQGITPESSSVGVEVEITPNISVDSNVRQSGASETGVKFKLDY